MAVLNFDHFDPSHVLVGHRASTDKFSFAPGLLRAFIMSLNVLDIRSLCDLHPSGCWYTFRVPGEDDKGQTWKANALACDKIDKIKESKFTGAYGAWKSFTAFILTGAPVSILAIVQRTADRATTADQIHPPERTWCGCLAGIWWNMQESCNIL